MKRLRDDDDRSSDGSDDGEDLKDFIAGHDEEEDDRVDTKSSEDLDLIINESKKIVEDLKTTVVNGRSLRNRDTLKKPEPYFDHENYKILMIQETKKEQLVLLKEWAKEGYVCPILSTLTKKSDADLVEAEYRKAKKALEIPDTDDEEEEEEEEEDDEDAEPESESSESSEEEDEDEDEDEEEEEDEEVEE
jgi:hypothetical protein